nr:ankyrin repeat domain-containing protein [Candidatus Synechococcus spongiarum]
MEVIRLLIQAGAKVDSTTRWGGHHPSLGIEFCNSNPLHVAALAGQVEIVQLLVEAGKDINGYLDFRTHRDLHTALTLALWENLNEEVAKLLIQAGADVNAPMYYYLHLVIHRS